MAEAEAEPEYIVVCIDNSTNAYLRGTVEHQIEAVKFYCQTKLEANPETEVTLFAMGSYDFSIVQDTTSDFQEILDCVSGITPSAGYLWFRDSIIHAVSLGFSDCPPNRQRRVLFLVGSLVDLIREEAKELGSALKRVGVDVDVVTFCLEEKATYMMNANQYGKRELNTFVRHAKSNNNSRIRHLVSFSSIIEDLSKFILRIPTPSPSPPPPHPTCTSPKTNHRKKAKGKNHATGDNKHVQSEASSLENERVKLRKRKRTQDV